MPNIPKNIEFLRTGPFFNMVTSFMVAFAGLKSIMGARNPLGLQDDGSRATLAGNIYPILNCDIFSGRLISGLFRG